MSLHCESERKFCYYCQKFTLFYKYLDGSTRQWVCECCSNSWSGGGGYR